jgi:phosphotransacetylase/acyl dehydratase
MQMIENKTFDELRVGDTDYIEKTLTDEDIKLFATVSGDMNPVHLDEEYARNSMFKERIAHGMWSAGLISAALSKLPGPGTIYLNQSLSFRRPVKIGDTIRVELTVSKLEPEKKRVILDCKCVNQNQETVTIGEAEVIAPTEKITREAMKLPQVELIDSAARLLSFIDKARKYNDIQFKIAIVYPINEEPIEGCILTAEQGVMTPVFIGPKKIMAETAKKLGKDISKYECIDVETSGEAAKQAVELAKNGEVQTLMKADIHSDELLRYVVSSGSGIRTKRRLSHCAIMDIPTYHKLLSFTDLGVNILPDLNVKKDIMQNAIDFVRSALEIEKPKVAVLSAVETVSEKMPSSVDAAILSKMAERGQIQNAIVDGPVSFDILSKEATETKNYTSPITGDPDIYLAPEIDTANGLVKELLYLANARGVGYVLGAKVPIILIGRYTRLSIDRVISSALAKIYFVKHNKLA